MASTDQLILVAALKELKAVTPEAREAWLELHPSLALDLRAALVEESRGGPLHTCSKCKAKFHTLNSISSSRGEGLGLFCNACAKNVQHMVDQVAIMHGARVVRGCYKSSPMGTPHFQDWSQVEAYLEANSRQNHITTSTEIPKLLVQN